MEIVNISWLQLLLGFIFIIIPLFFSLYESLNLEKTILIGVFRASGQLIFVGFLLNIIFDLNKWYLIVLIIFVMLIIASQALFIRIKTGINKTYYYSLIAVSTASILSIFVLSNIIINIDPWYNPQYIIPLSGMIIANGMNGATLAGERYKNELVLRLPEIEMLLSLGYSSKESSKRARQKALTSALLPSINNMMVMGIVSLPGMMTGQILSGINPIIAIKYQILIVLALLATNITASWLLLSFLSTKLFTVHHQVRYDIINKIRNT